MPPGVVNVVTGTGAEAGARARRAYGRRQDRLHRLDSDRPVEHPARSAGNMKRVSLELGGKSPVIVCADADLDARCR